MTTPTHRDRVDLKGGPADGDATSDIATSAPPYAPRPNRLDQTAAAAASSTRRGVASISSRPVTLAAGIAATRIVIGLVISMIAVYVIPVRGTNLTTGPSTPLTSTFIHWDAPLYQLIARSGYVVSEPGRTSFFPLYPYLTRLVHETGLGYDAAALLVSWVSLFFAVWGLIELSKLVWPRSPAVRAGILFAWFPASVFLISGYAEATFVALAAWCFVAVVRRRLLLAALLAGVASAARPEGALLVVVVVTAALMSRRYVKALLLGMLSEVGLVAFTVLVWIRYNNPFEYLQVQSTVWHRQTTFPLHPFFASLVNVAEGHLWGSATMAENVKFVFLLDDALIILTLAAIVKFVMDARVTRVLLPFVPFVILDFLLVVSNGPGGTSPEGSARVLMCIAPLYLVAVRLKNHLSWYTLLAVSAAVAAIFQVLFNLNLWFT